MDRPRSFIPSRDLTPSDRQQMCVGFFEAQRSGNRNNTWDLVKWAPELAIMFPEDRAQLTLTDADLGKIADRALVHPPTKDTRHRALESVRLLRPDRFNNLTTATGARPIDLNLGYNWRLLNIEANTGEGLDRLSAIRAAIIAFPDKNLEQAENVWSTTSRLSGEYSQPRQVEDETLSPQWSNGMEAIAAAKLAFPDRADQLPSIPQEGWDRLFRRIDRARKTDVSETDDWLLLARTLTSAAIISAKQVTRSEQGIHLAF